MEITLTLYQIGYITTQRKELFLVTLEDVLLVYILGKVYSKEKRIANTFKLSFIVLLLEVIFVV